MIRLKDIADDEQAEKLRERIKKKEDKDGNRRTHTGQDTEND